MQTLLITNDEHINAILDMLRYANDSGQTMDVNAQASKSLLVYYMNTEYNDIANDFDNTRNTIDVDIEVYDLIQYADDEKAITIVEYKMIIPQDEREHFLMAVTRPDVVMKDHPIKTAMHVLANLNNHTRVVFEIQPGAKQS